MEKLIEEIKKDIIKLENKEIYSDLSSWTHYERQDYRQGIKNTNNSFLILLQKINDIAEKYTKNKNGFRDSQEDLIYWLYLKVKIFEILQEFDQVFYNETLDSIESHLAEKQSKEKEERLLKFKEIANKIKL